METSNPTAGSRKGVVGVLQHILKLDYGPSLNTPIILFLCKWQKHQNTHGSNMYVKDADGFLMVNFKHKVPKSIHPFTFPEQCIEVFFGKDDVGKKNSD